MVITQNKSQYFDMNESLYLLDFVLDNLNNKLHRMFYELHNAGTPTIRITLDINPISCLLWGVS